MIQRTLFTLSVMVLLVTPAAAQSWAEKMFETKSHDFGTIARGAKAEYEFVLKNIYVKDVHISNVRVSCGCTTPSIKKAVKTLVTEGDSLEWMSSEVATLEKMIEDVAGPLAADGGHLAGDIYGSLPDLGWNNLTQTFLKTG